MCGSPGTVQAQSRSILAGVACQTMICGNARTVQAQCPDSTWTPRGLRGGRTEHYTRRYFFRHCCSGLQIWSPANGTFVEMTPLPDTVIVNAGDMLARWSNNIIKSTPHLVVELRPPKEHVPITIQRRLLL